MKRQVLWILFLVALVGLCAGMSYAQQPTADPNSLAATDPGAPVDVDPQKIGDDLVNVINQWKTIGWIAGSIALVNLLMLCLRLKPIEDFFEKRGWKTYKSWVASALGAISVGFTAYSQGVGIVQAIIVGVAAGWAAIGGHQNAVARSDAKEAAAANPS